MCSVILICDLNVFVFELIKGEGDNSMKVWRFIVIVIVTVLMMSACNSGSNNEKETNEGKESSNKSKKHTYSDIDYPKDGVKGIYVTPDSAKGENFEELIQFINETELNAMVIDVKDDEGNITMDFKSDNKLISSNTVNRVDVKKIIKAMEKNNIYPIARIVTFKDSRLSEEKPDWSFKTSDGNVWKSEGGDSFLNPFNDKVWKYNIAVAKEAAKAGFKKFNLTMFDFLKDLKTKINHYNIQMESIKIVI